MLTLSRNKVDAAAEQRDRVWLVFDGPAKGEETSKPKLIYREKEEPNYGAAK